MDNNENKKRDDLEKTGIFTDIMSRKDKKKYEKMVNEEKESKKDEKEKNNVNDTTPFDINETYKILEEDLVKIKNGYKEEKKKNNEQEIQKNEPIDIKENSKKEKKEKKNKKENDKVIKSNNEIKQNSNISIKIFSILPFITSVAYLIYSIFFLDNQVNYLYLMTNATIIVVITLFLMLTLLLNKKNIFGIITTLSISIFIIFNFLVMSNIIEMPTQALLEDFQNKTITEALKWGKENNIEINQIYEYSDNIEEYHIITQSVYPNTLLKNVHEITFTVSYGPNYEKIVSIPNMVGWDIDLVNKTIKENFLNNVNIEYEINEEVKKDTVIEQNISGQMRRSDELILKVSLGKFEELEPVEMINLKNMSLFDATLWLKRHGIKYETVYIFSDTIPKNYIADQETEVGKKVDPKTDTIKLIVSKGKKIIVPDLTKMTVDEATEWIIENNLKVKFQSKYDSIVELGKIISADYKEKDEIEAGTLITITTSLGSLKMPKFNNLNEFRAWANTNEINYREEYEFNNDVANGNIIRTIPEADTVINYSDTLVVYVSYGSPVTVPYFVGQYKDDILNTCYNIGLNCTFYYNGYSDTPYNMAQEQNKYADTQVVQGTYVNIGLSSGPAPVNDTPPTPQCDKSKTTTVWITPGNDGNQTKSMIENNSAYSGIHWNFVMVDSCPNNGDSGSGTVCNSYEIDGQNLNHCDTYTVTIVK